MTAPNDRARDVATDPKFTAGLLVAMAGLVTRDLTLFAKGAAATRKRLEEMKMEERESCDEREAIECEDRWRFLCDLESP